MVSVSEDIENIKEIVDNSNVFKEVFGKNQTICNVKYEQMFLWKVEFKTFIENSETNSSSEDKYYYWFGYDGLRKVIAINPLGYLELEQRIIYLNRHFLIENKSFMSDNGFLNLMKSIKGKYIPEILYNNMKVILKKYCNRKRFLRLHSSCYYPELTNHEM